MELNFSFDALSHWGRREWAVPLTSIACLTATALGRHLYYNYIHDKVIFDEPIPFKDFPPQSSFDVKRHSTYPSSYLNAWYHLCDSTELKESMMLEFHVVGQTLILWRKSDGTVVCQDAYCPHAGKSKISLPKSYFIGICFQVLTWLLVVASLKVTACFVHSTIGLSTVTER